MIRMAVLGSGSGGNATLVQCGDTRILVDAGLSAKQIVLRMEMLGVSPDDLDAILVTHENSDHARGIDRHDLDARQQRAHTGLVHQFQADALPATGRDTEALHRRE